MCFSPIDALAEPGVFSIECRRAQLRTREAFTHGARSRSAARPDYRSSLAGPRCDQAEIVRFPATFAGFAPSLTSTLQVPTGVVLTSKSQVSLVELGLTAVPSTGVSPGLTSLTRLMPSRLVPVISR